MPFHAPYWGYLYKYNNGKCCQRRKKLCKLKRIKKSVHLRSCSAVKKTTTNKMTVPPQRPLCVLPPHCNFCATFGSEPTADNSLTSCKHLRLISVHGAAPSPDNYLIINRGNRFFRPGGSWQLLIFAESWWLCCRRRPVMRRQRQV